MNYREIKIAGEMTKWVRCQNIICNNPYGGIPSVTMNWEQKIALPDGTVIDGEAAFSLTSRMTDPAKTFPKLNPETGEVIGEMTYMDLYVALWSLSHFVAEEKVAADAAAEASIQVTAEEAARLAAEAAMQVATEVPVEPPV